MKVHKGVLYDASTVILLNYSLIFYYMATPCTFSDTNTVISNRKGCKVTIYRSHALHYVNKSVKLVTVLSQPTQLHSRALAA